MKAYGIIKKITKYNYEVIKNIEVICFLPPRFIKNYKKLIESKLTSENEIKLMKYLNKNCLNKDKLYNYYELIDNESLIEVLQPFFSNNNNEESLHSKLNLYVLAKKKY